MKRISDTYVLWPFDKKFIFELVTCIRTRKSMVMRALRGERELPRLSFTGSWQALFYGQYQSYNCFFTCCYSWRWHTQSGVEHGMSTRTVTAAIRTTTNYFSHRPFSFVSLCLYSVIHISIHPSKELCSKMAPREVGVSLPWWCHTLVLLPPGY